MGLINEYGADLLDKIFFWRADFDLSDSGDIWFIGKITGYQSKNSVCKIFYKVLMSNHVLCHDWEFDLNGKIDLNAILINNSLALEKYLGLFNGTN